MYDTPIHMKKYYLLFLTLLCFGSANAQTIIKGSVRNGSGEPVVGANVYIKGTTSGTQVDADGFFQLQLAAGNNNAVIVISSIGYTTKEIAAGVQTSFDVVLEEDLQMLDEILITGYTSEEKGKITGAVNTIGEELISRLPVSGIDQALQGRAPGVVVTQNTGAPGEGVSVRIRGAGSINGSNSPLYIVDGIPTLDINSLSTQDIATITVLKDAGAAAVYGSRAANGVVIVTTKSGTGSAPKIQISSQVGVQSPSRRVEMANTNEYVTIYNEAATNDNATKNPLLHRPLITEAIRSGLPDVNYMDAIMRDGILQSHSISITGSEGKTRYFLSGTYFDQQGIIKSSSFNRLSSRINIDTEVKKWLKTGVNLNITKATTDIIGSSGDGAGGNGGSVVRYAFFRTPAIPIYNVDGGYTDKPSDNYDGANLYTSLFGDGYNPVGMLAYNNNKKISNRLFGKFFIELSPFRDVKFTSNLGIDFTTANQRRFDSNWGTLGRINGVNQLTIENTQFQTMTFSNFATYTRSSDDHNFTFLVGTEAIKTQNYNVFASEKDFPDQTPNLVYLGNGEGPKATSESKTGNALVSFFGKINYDFQEKLLTSVTLRRDGSSRFGPDNRWGNFYAGSLGWRLDKESFLINNRTIDRLMVRTGYGSIGNQEIGDYPFTDIIRPGFSYPLGNIQSAGYAVSQLGNNAVRWESSNQFNVGADLEMWNGKFSVSLDYFNKITSKLLVAQPIASSNGTDDQGNNHFIWMNNGKVLNRGIELIFNYSNTIGDFRYSIGGNAATLRNKVLQVDHPIPKGDYGSDYITLTEEGHPVGSFYLYEMEGIFQTATEIFTHAFQGNNIQPGDVKYKDKNSDGEIDGDDRAHLGSPIPKVTAGLNIGLNYKNWDLSIFFQGAYGQKIFSVLNRDIEGFYRAFNVTKRYYDNHWTGPGTSNEHPRASWDASGNNTIAYSSRFLEDGSYTRLKNIQIGYAFPAPALNKYGLSAVRIYFSGTNLFSLSKYSGLDPEMTVSDNARGQGDGAMGIDWGTYPSARSYNIGVNLTF
jgi:TonB-linked SusC/RagA family outer membrane protein